jgi:hypothetical protein
MPRGQEGWPLMYILQKAVCSGARCMAGARISRDRDARVMGLMTIRGCGHRSPFMKRFYVKVPLFCTVKVRAADEHTARRMALEVLASLTAQFGLADVSTRHRYDGAVIDIDFEIGNAELLRQKPRR